jgi:uncharacterized protein (DUF1330 family)
MPAFMIITARVHDRDAFLRDYGGPAAALVARMGGRYVLRGPGAQTLEGPDRDRWSVAVSEWPDRAAALAFWNSEDYQPLKVAREGLATCEVLLVGD